MGRGDNRKSPKVRRRAGWRKKKARLQRKIDGGAAATKGTAPAAKTTASPKK